MLKINYRRRYNPSRGGHSPAYFRDGFQSWVENGMTATHIIVDESGDNLPTRKLMGLLWNCNDTMPSSLCNELDMRYGSTYAQAVRKIKPTLSD